VTVAAPIPPSQQFVLNYLAGPTHTQYYCQWVWQTATGAEASPALLLDCSVDVLKAGETASITVQAGSCAPMPNWVSTTGVLTDGSVTDVGPGSRTETISCASGLSTLTLQACVGDAGSPASITCYDPQVEKLPTPVTPTTTPT
jgi:hypothetical protein